MATALLSLAEFITLLSLLGFDVALVYYLPRTKHGAKFMHSCFSIAGILAAILASAVIIFDVFPEMAFDGWKAFALITFVVINVGSYLINAIFIAMNKSAHIIRKDTIFSVLKVIFPAALVSLGAYGIFSSWLLALTIAIIASLFFINYWPRPYVDTPTVRGMLQFSLVNYAANLLQISPGLVLPLLITKYLSPNETAYFYVAWMITTLLFVIPASVSKTLLAQHDHGLKHGIRKSFRFTFMLLVPAVVITLAVGPYLLLIFGKTYSTSASPILRVLALSSIPFAFNSIFTTVMNLRKKLWAVIGIHAIVSTLSLTLSYMYILHGVEYVAWIWLATQSILALFTATWLVRYAA